MSRALSRASSQKEQSQTSDVGKPSHRLPIVNVSVGSHGSVQIVDFSTNVNIQSHSEDVLHKNAYMANPNAFISSLNKAEGVKLSKLLERNPVLKLVRKQTLQPATQIFPSP